MGVWKYVWMKIVSGYEREMESKEDKKKIENMPLVKYVIV